MNGVALPMAFYYAGTDAVTTRVGTIPSAGIMATVIPRATTTGSGYRPQLLYQQAARVAKIASDPMTFDPAMPTVAYDAAANFLQGCMYPRALNTQPKDISVLI
jgi:hypothetical protein